MNFKELIIFDLVLLRLTELSVIAHDSNIFKNIADLPIDKIMELYNQSEKQIFIAFDKEDTFYDVTSDIVHSTKVIELHENVDDQTIVLEHLLDGAFLAAILAADDLDQVAALNLGCHRQVSRRTSKTF